MRDRTAQLYSAKQRKDDATGEAITSQRVTLLEGIAARVMGEWTVINAPGETSGATKDKP